MPASVPRIPRQSQAERRTATVGKLVDAAVASLAEVGYTKTTIARVSELAGVSQGGLSRHFPTRLDLMAATAAAVADSHLALFAEQATHPGVGTVELLRLLRQNCRSPLNAAWYELFLAARTDDALLERLAPVAAVVHGRIEAFWTTLPKVMDVPENLRNTLLWTVIHLFDGEAISSVVVPHPEHDETRIQLVEWLLDAASAAVPQRVAS